MHLHGHLSTSSGLLDLNSTWLLVQPFIITNKRIVLLSGNQLSGIITRPYSQGLVIVYWDLHLPCRELGKSPKSSHQPLGKINNWRWIYEFLPSLRHGDGETITLEAKLQRKYMKLEFNARKKKRFITLSGTWRIRTYSQINWPSLLWDQLGSIERKTIIMKNCKFYTIPYKNQLEEQNKIWNKNWG